MWSSLLNLTFLILLIESSESKKYKKKKANIVYEYLPQVKPKYLNK